jgi:CspA family cold shock protein
VFYCEYQRQWVKKRKKRCKMKGVVKWFNDKKGYGFIADEEGNDVFVHYQEIQGDGFKTLQENDNVEFEIGQGEKGPKAINVRKV